MYGRYLSDVQRRKRSACAVGQPPLLILARRVGETIVISDEVFVTVLSVNGNQIRLGIDAPRSVKVLRSELHNRVEEAPAPKKSRGLA